METLPCPTGLSSVPCTFTDAAKVPDTGTCCPESLAKSPTSICVALRFNCSGLDSVKAHLCKPALASKVILPCEVGSRSACCKLAEEGLTSTFVRSTRQEVPLKPRFEAVSCPVRWGSAGDPRTVPWNTAVPASPRDCVGLPGVGGANNSATVSSSLRLLDWNLRSKLERRLTSPFIVNVLCGVRRKLCLSASA